MLQENIGDLKYLPRMIFTYTESKAKLWEAYLSKNQSIFTYYEMLENYKSVLMKLTSSLAYAQETCDLTGYQRIAYDSIIHQLLEENKIIKAFTQTYCQNFNAKTLNAKERKLKQEMREYYNDLPDEPDIICKKYFTDGITEEEITFKSPFSIDDGECIHHYQPTAKIKVLPR